MVVMTMDIIIYVAVLVAIVFRLVIMKGSFTLPTIYKNGDEVSFNLGSIATIVVALLAALAMMTASPELFSNPVVAFLTTYSAPQILDGVASFGVRNTIDAKNVDNK